MILVDLKSLPRSVKKVELCGTCRNQLNSLVGRCSFNVGMYLDCLGCQVLRMKKKLQILVFEDDPALVTLLGHALQSTGHDVHFFSEPMDCPIYHDHKAQCPQDRPCADIIISDHMMPNMTGIDFLKLQKMSGCKIPDENKALITGTAMNPELKVSIEELGCHYIKKPFRIVELIKWIDECAQRVLAKPQL